MNSKQDGEEAQTDCFGLATLPGILLHSEACPVPTVRITSLTLACSSSVGMQFKVANNQWNSCRSLRIRLIFFFVWF